MSPHSHTHRHTVTSTGTSATSVTVVSAGTSVTVTSAAVPGQGGHTPEPAENAPDSGEAPPTALVVTVSTRAAAGTYPDRSGPVLLGRLTMLGFATDGPVVVPDGDEVERVLREAVAHPYEVVVTTGGTGLAPTDRTPEATRRVLDFEVPGIPEALRAAGYLKLATAALSRGVAGVAGGTLIVNLPGSVGGVSDGMDVLDDLLRHAVDQLRGGDHRPRGDGSAGDEAPWRSH